MNFLIIDNKPLSQKGLQAALASLFPDAKVLLSSSIADSVPLFDSLKIELVIIDHATIGKVIAENLKKFISGHPALPILMVSEYDEQTYAIPYLNAGVHGFISHKASLEEFEQAISNISRKKRYASYEVMQHILTGFLSSKGSSANPAALLTKGERKVADLMMENQTKRQIAEKLNLTETTIAGYQRNLITKFGVTGLKELLEQIRLTLI